MEKTTIQANPDNDLKFWENLTEEDKKKKKKPVPTGELTEKAGDEEPLQYFTE